MRLQVLVAGFNRSLSLTYPTIASHVVKPLHDLDPNLLCSAVVSRSSSTINNVRSREYGRPEYGLPKEMASFAPVTVEQDQLDREQADFVHEILELASPPTQQDEVIVRNILRYLQILKIAGRHVDNRADYVFHLRPDLYWHDDLRLPGLVVPVLGIPRRLTGMMTASWGGGKAPNDRFALLSRGAVDDYFFRIHRFKEFLLSGLGFSAENFLGFAMSRHKIRPVIRATASRVRVGGKIAQERFRPTGMGRTS